MSIYPILVRPLLRGAPALFSAGNYNNYEYQDMYNPHSGLSHYTHKKPNYNSRKKVLTTNTMPKGTKTKRRPYRRRRIYRRRRKTAIPQAVVPSTRLVKMRLCERMLLTGTTGATGNANIYYNSLQDPLISNGTNQPYYYDQIKTMYRTAIVVGAKLSVTFHNTSSTVPAVVGLYLIPWDNSTSITNYEYFREIVAKGRQRILSSDIDTCHMSLKISPKKHLGISNFKDADEVKCDIENDGDPSKLGAVTVMSQALDQSSTSTVEAIIVLEQIVILRDPFQPARSVDV